MTNTYTWRTAALIRETHDTVTVRFDTGGTPFSYRPGQFINLTLTINGARVTRSYSLSSCPGEDAHPAITVKQVTGGLMSTFIVQQAADIKEWQVAGPHGAFTPSDNAYAATNVVLLAGGSGITPLWSIARAIRRFTPQPQLSLVYSSRTANDIIFREAIETSGVQAYHALSQPAEGFGGRLNKLVVKKLIKNAVPQPQENTHYFICGPAALMKMHLEVLSGLGVPEAHIHKEYFQPEADAPAPELPQQMQEVLMHFYDQYNLLEVQPGQTILSAALADHVPVPYSCNNGTCGTCTARVTAGRVSMANNYALRNSEVEQGMVLLCQSYPLTPDVTVQIG
ncbi:hypothetical protein EGT74_23910 [Chitinophaga lutea]|uniref:Iron-sulfur cluster-binding domain-containing protein n=1 Tax=Chitinophaga lutea TaxID=2488634 RepID=A0A3N4Q0Z2_9BACT|nr:iron-sulfur cluster-binding domain-containing protein [Chitinophaga lutea]RPE05434.1 hypothetical protein EGT74_23910 [Chitinophaga lutea]